MESCSFLVLEAGEAKTGQQHKRAGAHSCANLHNDPDAHRRVEPHGLVTPHPTPPPNRVALGTESPAHASVFPPPTEVCQLSTMSPMGAVTAQSQILIGTCGFDVMEKYSENLAPTNLIITEKWLWMSNGKSKG